MKQLLIILISMCSFSVNAAIEDTIKNNLKKTVTLKMALSIDGVILSNPKIVTYAGEVAHITQTSDSGEGTFIEVTPILKQANTVFMKFKVGQIKNGEKIVLSEPQIESLVGEKAEVSIDSTDGPFKKLSLAVTVNL